MDTQTSWSKNSIVNIATDPIHNKEGEVNKASLALTLGSNAKVSFLYTYGQSQELIKSNKLQIILICTSSDPNQLTRSNNNLETTVDIQYYNEILDSNGEVSNYDDGVWDSINVYPYLQSESIQDGRIDEYIVDIENKYIKQILVTFINRSNNTITFRLPRIYRSLGVEDTVRESGISGQAAQIVSMQGHTDGKVIWYKGKDRPAFVKIIPQTDNVKIFNVSDVYSFGYNDTGTPMPYGRTDEE